MQKAQNKLIVYKQIQMQIHHYLNHMQYHYQNYTSFIFYYNHLLLIMTTPKRKAQEPYDYLVKMIIIGDSGVGKTNFLMQFCEGSFKGTYVATIGVDFKTKIIQVENKKIKLQIWDTAGQERFRNITQTYYKGAAGIILMYSIIDEQSFKNIEKWINQINESSSPDVAKVLIGNKSDLINQRKISYEQGAKLAEIYNMPFYEASAKDSTNVEQTFVKLGKSIKQKLEKGSHGGINTIQSLEGLKSSKKGCQC